jgi:hypothetical protein
VDFVARSRILLDALRPFFARDLAIVPSLAGYRLVAYPMPPGHVALPLDSLQLPG